MEPEEVILAHIRAIWRASGIERDRIWVAHQEPSISEDAPWTFTHHGRVQAAWLLEPFGVEQRSSEEFCRVCLMHVVDGGGRCYPPSDIFDARDDGLWTFGIAVFREHATLPAHYELEIMLDGRWGRGDLWRLGDNCFVRVRSAWLA